MEQRIVFKNEDGSVSIVTPAPSWKGTIDELAAKDVPNGLDWKIIDASDLPINPQSGGFRTRTYRNAWSLKSGRVVVDLVKAKDIHLENIRRIRGAKLVDLDARWQAAERDGGDTADLQAERTELLGATDIVSAANPKTADELYAMWPVCLERRTSM